MTVESIVLELVCLEMKSKIICSIAWICHLCWEIGASKKWPRLSAGQEVRLRMNRSLHFASSLSPSPRSWWITSSLGNFGRFSAWLPMTFWICLFRWRLDKKQEQPSGGINSLHQAGSTPSKGRTGLATNLPTRSLPLGSLSPWGPPDCFD